MEQAQTWIHSALATQGIAGPVEIEQIHIRPWSTVLRVAAASQTFFFKATAPIFDHETSLTSFLADQYPELAPQVLAADLHRHWLLMHSSGLPLRSFVKAEKSIERWREVLPLYVDLQKCLSKRQPELLAMGVMDRRLERLPVLFDELQADQAALLLDQPEGLTSSEYELFQSMRPRFERMCARLAAFHIPESLHHDDFHDGNIFVQNGRIIFTDWGESAVTHPFFSLVVMLRSLENSLDLTPEAPELTTLRDWYLSLWQDWAPADQLKPALQLAERIGYINRALTWRMVISELPAALKPEYSNAVPAYVKEFIHADAE